MTLEDAIALTAGRDMWSTAATADVPSLRMADGPMGIASGRVDERDVSILTPSGVSLAATWDTDLVAKIGAMVGGEAKARGVDCVLAPNLNLQRTPLGGRAFEMFGEDPLLAGTLGAAWIDGLQSRRVGAVAKHLVCNESETARDSFSAQIEESVLRQVYLLPFEMAARAQCAGIMAAYNKVNGVHCSEHHHLLTTILCEDWRFDGFTVCDWFGTRSTGQSMRAGLDLEMPGPPRFYGSNLAAAVDVGDAPREMVLAAARRVARQAHRFAGGDAGAEPGDRDEILAEAAAASFVLLRNDGDILPVRPRPTTSIAVIGPNAIAPCFQGGTFAKVSLRPDAVSPIAALRARFGKDAIAFAPGCDPSPRLPSMPATPARDLDDGCSRGMTVDYFDSHDFTLAPVGSETRDTNSLIWFGGMPGIGAFDGVGGVRASGIVVPQVSGRHVLHIGGTGSISLTLDGRRLLSAEREITPSDIMGVLKGGDSETVEVELTAGTPVRIDAELRFRPARAHGLWYGLRGPRDAETLLAEAEALAKRAETVLLVLGETADSGVESKDRETTALPEDQEALARRVIAANPNVVVVVNVAHAFDPSIAEGARGLMVVWYPGEAFGPALADVVAGVREPSGRLPITIARRETDYPVFASVPDEQGRLDYSEGERIGYRGFAAKGIEPAFAFGAGLGYGRVEYVDASTTESEEGGTVITVRARNHADRSAAAVVQVYRDDGALAGFAKQVIAAGSDASISVEVDPLAMRIWNNGRWARWKGNFRIGPSSGNLPLSLTAL